jgi:hypothetical protein
MFTFFDDIKWRLNMKNRPLATALGAINKYFFPRLTVPHAVLWANTRAIIFHT